MLSLQFYSKSKNVITFYGDGVCLSSDSKPIGNVENGSKLIEMDTGKIYIYDAQNNQWREFT